jgi:hypothetical protein
MIFTAQEHFPPVTQAEAQDLERLRYRWLTHASRLCDRRRRRGSDAPVVAFFDIWAIEYHKREGECLQAQAAGACRVVDPVILPLHRLTGGGGGGTGRRELECGPHSFLERYPVTRFDVDAERDAKGRARRDVLGDHICAAMPELPITSTETDIDLTNRHSRCENCKLGPGSALTPTISQDAAMSELIARLHAAEIAAEVEALQPKTPSPVHSNASSDRSVAGVVAQEIKPMIVQAKALAEKPVMNSPINQPTTTQSSRFHENIPSAAKSMPTLATTPQFVPTQAFKPSTASTTLDLPMTPSSTPTNTARHTRRRTKSRDRRRRTTRSRWGWMALWKKSKRNSSEQ